MNGCKEHVIYAQTAILHIVPLLTNIDNVDLKHFLSNVKTKHELTIFLGNMSIKHLMKSDKTYSVVFNGMCLTHRNTFSNVLHAHSQEEANTLVMLYSHEISGTYPFTEVYISSPDTYVFVSDITRN